MDEPAEDMNRLVDDAKEEMEEDEDKEEMEEDKEDFEMQMEVTLGMDRSESLGSEMDLLVGVNLEEGAL